MLIFLLMVVFSYAGGRFIFVKAFSSQINIFPESFLLEQNDKSGTEWQNIKAVFYQDLSSIADLDQFNIENSAYLTVNTEPSATGIFPENAGAGIDDAYPEGQVAGEFLEQEDNSEIGDLEFGIREEEEGDIVSVDVDNEILVDESESELISEPVDMPAPGLKSDQEKEIDPELSADDDISLINKIKNRFKLLSVYFSKFDIFNLKLAKADDATTTDSNDDNSTSTENDAGRVLAAPEAVQKSSIIFSNFSVPLAYYENRIGNINLRMSLAGKGTLNDNLIVAYSINNNWQELGKLNLTSAISNAILGDYFQFALPDEVGWEDIGNLKVKIEAVYELSALNMMEAYLDALWLEVDYNSSLDEAIRAEEEEYEEEEEDEEDEEEDEEEIFSPMEGRDFDFDLLSERENFKSAEAPRFEFRFKKKRGLLRSMGAGLTGVFHDEYKDMEISSRLKNREGQIEEDINFNINYLEDGKFKVEFLDKPRQFRPGRHVLEITMQEGGETFIATQDFVWGVLAFNINKSIFLSGEQAYLQMAVLDDNGDTICDADLSLEITAPDGGVAMLSTDNGLIIRNPECGPNNVINAPDYYGYYGAGGIGAYAAILTAWTANGERNVSDSFEVRGAAPFEIERVGPTRIYPVADYEMKFRIKANGDFKGKFIEYAPNNFKIVEKKRNGAVIHNDANIANEYANSASSIEKEIVWQVDWEAGQEYLLSYTFDAPNVSPEFYLLGPAQLSGEIRFLTGDESIWEEYNFKEIRQWQIASDALTAVYTGPGRTPVEINGTEDTIDTLSGFTNSDYILFGGIGNVTYDGGTSRIQAWLDDGAANITVTQEQQEGPDADDRAAYFSMTQRTMTSGDTIYLMGDDPSGSGEADEFFIMGMDTASMGAVNTDYFWNEDTTTDATVGTTIAGEDNRASITFTPDGSSQYLFIATARLDEQVSEEIAELAIWDGSVAMVNHIRDTEDTANADEIILFAATTTVPAAVPTTYAVRARGESASTIDYLSSSILIIRLNYYEDFSCDAGANRGSIGLSPTVMATTDLQLTNSGDVMAIYFGGFDSNAQGSEVSLRARQDSTVRYQITEGDTGNEPGRNAVWETSDIHNLIWLDNITGEDTSSHTYDISMEASALGPTAPWAMVCAWSEAEAPVSGDVTVSATGTQASIIEIDSINNYVGGVFVLTENNATSSVESITITESGSVDASSSLANIKLYYDLDTSDPYNCISENFSLSDSRFGATSTNFSSINGTSTFSGAVEISTVSSMCVYTVLDVESSASSSASLEIEIADPSTDVALGSGTVDPGTSVELNGTTNLVNSVTVTATGTQDSSMTIPSTNNYLGGAFIFTANIGSHTITDITIAEDGSVDAQSNLENIKLYYDLSTTSPYNCSEHNYSLSDPRFGATSTSFSAANGTSTFSGAVDVSTTTTMCLYTVLDVGSGATYNETLNIKINNPSTDIIITSSVGPGTAVDITGSSTLSSPPVAVSANEQRKSDNFTTIANGGWTNENQVNLSALAQSMGGATTSKYDFYFEFFDETGAYTTATSAPASPCSSEVAYNSCGSKIWTVSASTTTWYDEDWGYRRKITINASKVSTTTSAFVVLATTTASGLAHTSHGGHTASSTGGDILLIDSDGSTILDYEREYYSSSTGELIIWVETGISSTTNKTIYLYYGNSSLTADQQDRIGTWDGAYAVVQHMNEDPTTSILYDSTSNNNDATDYGDPQSVSGKIGPAVDFDGSGDYALIDDSASIDGCTGQTQPRTWSYWMNFNEAGSNKLITDKSNLSGRHLWAELQATPNQIRGGADSAGQLISSFNPDIGDWHYITFVFDGSNAMLYIDGLLDDGPNAQSPNPDNNDALRVMGRADDTYCTNGIMDELRISNIARELDWIKTEYNNQHNVNDFLSFAAEESILSASYEGVVNITSIPDRGTTTGEGYKWQVLACDDQSSCSDWDDFNSTIPNFKVDTDLPGAPGNLTLSTTTITAITLNFGSSTEEANFSDYKIFYKSGIAGVDTLDTEHNDSNLDYINYNGAATTTITDLDSNTQYVINIWAYDQAGNKTGATEIVVTTQSAPHARAGSVQFLAGDYSGDGTAGQLTDTNQTFSAFNFKLAETDVEIRSAYILFEAQFEAYHSNSGDYTGYNLAFDACADPCTADAFSGTSSALKDDNTVLAYNETESNQVRLLLDVTSEAQLAAYAGDSANMEAQVGYKIETGSATTSIANAKAVLVITYSFDDDNSTDFTNTVIYPLESTNSGDSGTRLSSQTDDCVKDSDCPLFDYNMQIPEFSTKLSQWFQAYGLNDGNGTNDINININIEGTNIDSDTFTHEAENGEDQGNMPRLIFNNVSGFAENTAQTLEYYAGSNGAPAYYLIGGEVVETYTAAKSATTKTRTASFPLGIITNGQSTATASGTVNIYFPENGSGSGIVDIKKAWFRIISNNYNSGAYTLTAASKAGDNSQSSNYAYNLNAGDSVIKPSFNIIHVIPASDYSELESANAVAAKEVILYTTNSSVDMGGVAAELMITYTYSDETSGYLASLDLFAGQSDVNGNTQSNFQTAAEAVFPELRGTETVRAGALLGSFLLSDSDGDMPADWFTMDINIATSSPACANAFSHRADGMNSFSEFYRDVTSAINTVDDQSYAVCYSNTNTPAPTAGAKMNAVWRYTYQWDAPPTELTQNDWRWYNNIDAIEPTTAKAAENTSISGVNIGDISRLRMNLTVTQTDLATSTQTFKLQFAQGADCSAISSSTWDDVGGIAGSEAWLGYNNPDPDDGVTLSADSTLLASSTKPQSYEEINPSATNPRGVAVDGYGEWDWVIYNNSATSSSNYCFRMVKGDSTELDDYLADGYPMLTSAASNTAPNNPASLEQYRDDGITVIANMSWINASDVKLIAAATDPNMSEVITLYFELASSTGSFTTATSVPSGACDTGTAYTSCSSKIWTASSTAGDYRTSAFIGTTSITSILESSSGYKWQVLACDDSGTCSDWAVFSASVPNFKVDITAPSPPGDLIFATSTPTTITLNLGASTTEDNFEEYKIFYKVGTAGVTEGDPEHTDSNLSEQDYDGATTTFIIDLSAGTTYVFNIWAYDQAGNKASSTVEAIGTTTSAFNPPTGFIDNTTAQKTNGSGIVDFIIVADDPDNDDTLRAKVFYEAGDTCGFAVESDPTLDETDANIIATYGDPDIDNNYPYQVGTTSNWILTSPGSNYVFFDWMSKTDIPAANGDYCLGLVINDGVFSQTATHTKVITIDNVDPTAPGQIATSSKDYNSVTLAFGSDSFDTRFDEYKIFYKEGMSGVTENDNEFNKDDDPNLDEEDYGGAATTTITGLNPNTWYVFNVWAYDTFGNKASATAEFSIKTNAAPINISADEQYLDDEVTTIINNSWIDENSVVLSASVHDQDAGDLMSFYYELITATGTYTIATTAPLTACASGTPYLTCSNNIWQATTTSSLLPADWYDSNWLYRKRITINASQVATTSLSFPVLATTTDSGLAAHARGDGYDILFTDSTGTSTLLYEREYYNSSTGELAVWIRANISSTTDTEIYMYYGNSGAITDNATTTGVWDNNFKGVWHLEENVVDESSQANAHEDSTVNDNDGDQEGNNEITSRIYQGQDFDGVNDYIKVDDDTTLDITDAITMEFWMKGTVTSPPAATSTVFSTAGNNTFTVPPGVTEITVKTWGGGAGGGAGSALNGVPGSNPGGDGGGGGFVQSTLDVTPGEVIDVHVGGGGTAGVFESDNSGDGGGGGGRSEVSRNSASLLIASGGGGGGGGSDRDYASGGDGGAGGGLTGISGGSSGSANGGGGGTQSTGGAAGTGANDGQTGDSQAGGDGADGRCAQGADGSGPAGGTTNGGAGGDAEIGNRCAGAGGGGSGYFGGGGGGQTGGDYNAGAGGGGGSFFATSTATATSTEAGSGTDAGNNDDADYANNAGQGGAGGAAGEDGVDGNNGRVVITYTPGITVAGKGSDAYQINLNSDLYLSGQINTTSTMVQISGGWHHVALTYDRNAGGTEELKLFVDGVKEGAADISEAINTNADDLKIGEIFDGIIDELQISNIARSPAWIQTRYNNQKSVGGFLSFSGESTVTSYYETALIITIPDNPDHSSGYKWQVMACDDDEDCSAWDQFNAATPNFKIDTTDPSAPGQLTEGSKTSNYITLNFGIQTDEDNFVEYKIYYSTSSPVTESDNLHSSSTDSNLGYVDYNSATDTTVTGLAPDTTYYFNIWAYDFVGHKASSTITSVITNSASSSPGAVFYTKGTRTLYYSVWSGSGWGGEQAGPDLGSNANMAIRHIRTVRSDNGGTIGILAKASSTAGIDQEWWGTVYRFAADDFVNTAQLGATSTSADNAELITGCIAALSGNEFIIIRNNNISDGTLVYSWNNTSGWVAEGAGPSPGAVLNGCVLERRLSTDNYLLMTFDDDSDVGSAYYYGGATYANSWTAWTEHSTDEEDIDNYIGEAFFDPSDNTRGALNYSNSNNNDYTYAKYFTCDNSSINYGGAVASPSTNPDDWSSDFVHGEFAPDPGGTGIAYYAGRDIGGELNIYKVDVTNPVITWTTSTGGDNITNGNLYSETNNSQKPFAIAFYKSGKGLAAFNSATDPDTPKYSLITTAGNIISASSSVPGASGNLWTRARLYNDPGEDETLAIYQNDDIDYAAVFFNGGGDEFYSVGTQAWTELVTAAGALEADDENISFAYSAFNSPANTPAGLAQYKSDASTTIANQAWTDETTVKFKISATDPDTYEIITLYLNLVTNIDDLATGTAEAAFNSCASTTPWGSCNSKIWAVASSTVGDYSVTPFTATATITSIASSSIGYKWQAIACDDEGECSSWLAFNPTQPNFYVDDLAPTSPGSLTDTAVNSGSVTLQFGTASIEDNFLEYKIFYKIGASGVTESDNAWTQADDDHLDNRLYDGFTETTITGLSSSTQYVFNIWVYDMAGNTASATAEVSTTTSALPNVIQTSFLLENDDGGDVNSNTAEVAASTTLTNINIGERINARIQIENNGGDTTGNKIYKLQFDTDYDDSWTDVGAATAISYSYGLSGTNGSAISTSTAVANNNIWKDGTWHENTNLTGSFSLNYDYYTEFVFAIETSNATTSKTYRLRLYNNTDSQVLGAYINYPTISTIASDLKRYSKGLYASLPSNSGDLTYYSDPEGYADILSNDANRDVATSSSQYPVFLFATKHTNNTDAASSTWNGQSTVGASTNNIILQVYRFGSTNAWVTMYTETAAGAGVDFNLTSGAINSSLDEYYASGNWIYWRVYQELGSQTLKSDYFSANFAPPVPETKQIHYAWRRDDGDETGASWLEAEDTGSPTLGSPIGKGSTTRLRMEAVNIGGGDATNYAYRLEYASSSDGCTADFSAWTPVPVTAAAGEHFEIVDSAYFGDASTTTYQLDNGEGYTFVTGDMIEDPSNTSANITLPEDRYTEVEYVLQVTNDAENAMTYCFRVTNGGTVLDSYDLYAAVTLSGSTNAAPSFSAGPSDGGSASTSPTNYGANVNFSATANDGDGHNYYLAVCQTNSITPGNDAPPTCNGGQWCISSFTVSGVGATCNYSAATSSETLAWYAFACDKVLGFGIAKCSSASQGVGNALNDSPFVVNHPPNFTSVATTEDNKDPGGTFIITASVADNDIADIADTLDLFICTQNSAVAGAGCSGVGNQELCSELATSSPNASCSFSTSTPATAGAWTYYAFVFDSHDLAAADNSRSSTFTVNNVKPTLGALSLNGGSPINLNIKPNETTMQTINTSVQDQNGCNDLDSSVAAIYMSNASGGYNCTNDDNDCYQITTANCVINDCASSSDMLATYTCSTTLKYFAVPTDDQPGNPNEPHKWMSYMRVYDGVNYSDPATSTGVELITVSALDVAEAEIGFGGWNPGDNTGVKNSTSTVVNYGNSPIDTNVSGIDMTGNPSGQIAVDQIKWNLINFNYPIAGIPLTGDDAKAEIIAPKATSTDDDVEDEIYWGIGIPFIASTSHYTGLNTFSVILDSNDW